MKKLFRQQHLPTSEKGQSLVELAIVAPILIFMLIGVFEVGWALRGYLVLTNVNREITRFAIRPGYLDYSIKDGTKVGYEKVYSYTFASVSDQLPLDFTTGQTSTLIISHLVVDTGLPCRPEDIGTNDCNCNQFLTDPNYNPFPEDDLILHPLTPTYEDFYTRTFPDPATAAVTFTTRLSYTQMAAELAQENNKFNCELLSKGTGTLPSSNNIIVTELFFNQPQLFGFPLISNPLTDPVPMYTHTAMRMIVAARSGENVDTVGPVCTAYPFTIRQSIIDAANINDKLDIFGGNGPNDFGWLGWNGISTTDLDTGYLSDELKYPRMALNDFYDARDTSDRTLSIGDHVASLEGVNATIESSEKLLTSLIGRTIRIPVWDSFVTGSPNAYHISSFAWVRIDGPADFANWTAGGSDKQIFATYLGDASGDCPVGD